MIAAIPLMIIPLIIYNAMVFGPFDAAGTAWLSAQVLSVNMISGTRWVMQNSDLIIVVALVLLFVEILKATRSGGWSVANHVLSAVVFVAFVVEFLLVREAANNVFFILTVIAFIDLIAGFSVSIKSAGRDVSIGL
ncbi:hypothetical protein [Nitratireductor sp. XY-223]|uniref:hypothetical protein n=1 Tax=Nitratireductor sp. XY-223 TaxID=2561926 RepID=UPI0010A9BE1E|nr:hypothetical protein [Nitratireductor sp. XY-223]